MRRFVVMEIKTKKTLEREAREKAIIKEYDKIHVATNQITAEVEKICEKLNIGFSIVYRVIKKYKEAA